MAGTGATTCPHCGSTNTRAFPDGAGVCGTCGRAFRGSAPVGVRLAGEEAGPRMTAAPRQTVRIGILGLAGGLLGFGGIPGVFAIGAALHGRDVSTYVSEVFNRPEGALTCGGVALLVIFAWYATWAAYHVWRGYPERAPHLVAAGSLLAASGAIAGQGLAGIVGILGGLLALLTGLLIWLRARGARPDDATKEPQSS